MSVAEAPTRHADADVGLRTSRIAQVIRRPEFGSFVAFLLVFAFFVAVAGDNGFWSISGIAGMLNVTAELAIIAIPVGLLVIAGGLDLSVGAMVGTSSVIVAIGSGYYGQSLWLMIALAFVFAVLIGLFNGFVTIRTGLPAFIVTLATWFMVSGLALGMSRALTGTSTVSLPSRAVPVSARALFASQWGRFHVAILWWLGVTVVASVVLLRTRFGNWAQATGGDHSAARAAGVKTGRVKVALFVTVALAATLVGVIQTVEFRTGNATNGSSFIFTAIIAVMVGGVLLTGGYGSPIGVALGALTYGVVSQGIFYTGWSNDFAQLFLGALLLAAVLANNYFRRLALTAR